MQPSAAPLDTIRPADDVLIRGLGLSFDYMADFTLGRGGKLYASPVPTRLSSFRS